MKNPDMIDGNASYADIIKAIHKSRAIIIVSHRKPDGDTAGAALALAHYLESVEKPYSLYCVDVVGPEIAFLPKAGEIGPHEEVWGSAEFDMVVVLDASDLKHAGVAEKVKTPERPRTVINIDHHHTNLRYGDYNLVISDASSTCEIVYYLLDSVRAVTREVANCLLTGVVTDTGSFSNLATTASSVQAASQLVAKGANLSNITRQALQYRPLATLKLWGRALERLHVDAKTGMVVTAIGLDDIAECKADDEAVSGISNFLNGLEQAAEKAVMVITQSQPGVIKGSLRTTNPLIDVSEFAKLHGGGGHKKAAGFTINGTLTITDHEYTITPIASGH